ncbi:MAG: hypothetical protein ABI610_01590 [Acidobacteriota bacterium]
MSDAGARTRFGRVFKSIETVVAMAILASACLFAGAYFYTILRRERIKAAAHGVHQLVLSARMQAVRRERYVVLQVDVGSRELASWIDDPPQNFVRDPGERFLGSYRIPEAVAFRSVGGSVGGSDSVSFDKYQWNDALVDRIVFRGDGSLVIPQATNSRPPVRPRAVTASVTSTSINCPPAGCRGIFLADRSGRGTGKNVFRVSVDDFGRIGRVSLLKWLPPGHGGNAGERDFTPPPWEWVD